jgi:hypothetical protein
MFFGSMIHLPKLRIKNRDLKKFVPAVHSIRNDIKYLIFPPRGSSELIHNQGSKHSFSIAGALDVGGDLICISVQ